MEIILLSRDKEDVTLGHIPYPDSKLTSILQSVLGGNAKTSFICTAAPKEIHMEETRGTVQSTSRTRCVSDRTQILTDAGMLKRHKLEIEKLRQKLQCSLHACLGDALIQFKVSQKNCHVSILEPRNSGLQLKEFLGLRPLNRGCKKRRPSKSPGLSYKITEEEPRKKRITLRSA
ncbi:kinesin-like protein KIN-7L isoform X2 [Lolium perenne]|uniref:kinesin-like protein KIN-7L isoform X2 n=1 Tax=Lolium perenne TaxID=4522 RepID=UPI0021F564A1|nr:kinesin-like protein KIN-7L isoform X2 [Lolium perenne]